jgi:hypothetical protein
MSQQRLERFSVSMIATQPNTTPEPPPVGALGVLAVDSFGGVAQFWSFGSMSAPHIL